MLNNLATLFVVILKSEVSLRAKLGKSRALFIVMRAKCGNLGIVFHVIARNEVTWQSRKEKLYY
jgi:hypothetical protein